MERLDEKLSMGDFIKIKDKAKKLFMKRLKMTKDVVMSAFKIVKKDPGLVHARSEADNKIYKLGEDDLKPAYWYTYTQNLKSAWQENIVEGKRITVKEVSRWFKGLEENKWRKTYPIDVRRIAYFANNHGMNEEECAEMPKSLKKKKEGASYKREQKYATRYIEHLESKKLEENYIRRQVRDILTEIMEVDSKNSPLGKAIDYAKQYRITKDKKYLDLIRKVLSFQTKSDVDAWIKQHIK